MKRENDATKGNRTFTHSAVNNPLRILLSTLASGTAMWVMGGFWHNLILPMINDSAEAHHDGLGLSLIAYCILGFLMLYVYLQSEKEANAILQGIKTGMIIGILWVFPHGLVMAGTHDTSIAYELKNTLYHMVEQGFGGLVLAWIWKKKIQQAS